jgi:flagellar biosynthesis protein FliQ
MTQGELISNHQGFAFDALTVGCAVLIVSLFWGIIVAVFRRQLRYTNRTLVFCPKDCSHRADTYYSGIVDNDTMVEFTQNIFTKDNPAVITCIERRKLCLTPVFKSLSVFDGVLPHGPAVYP